MGKQRKYKEKHGNITKNLEDTKICCIFAAK